MSPARVDIMLIEDNEGDVFLLRQAFRKNELETVFHVAVDGQEAVDRLQQKKHGSDAYPDLILLDLNIPKIHGHQVLEFIKSDEKLRRIPTIVLSSSADDKDVERCYRNYANSYIEKPHSLDGYFKMARSIEDFWISVSRKSSKLN